MVYVRVPSNNGLEVLADTLKSGIVSKILCRDLLSKILCRDPLSNVTSPLLHSMPNENTGMMDETIAPLLTAYSY